MTNTHTYEEERWIATYVRSAATSMIRRQVIRTMEYLRELNSKTCPTTGFALFAARQRKISKRKNNRSTQFKLSRKVNFQMGYGFNAGEVFKVAIQIEENGRKFYEESQKIIEGAQIKALFAELAQQEIEHKKKFE